MSSENSFGQFVARNKTAIAASVAAGATAVGAYYYYQQLQDAKKPPVESKKEAESELKSSKKKKKSKKKTQGSTPSYPVDANGEPDLTNVANLTSEQKDKIAMGLKDKGNEFFKGQKFEEAIKFYSMAIEVKEDPVFYSNRSACYVSLGQQAKVVEDTTAALKLKPDYSKCLLRRASANESLGNFADAMFDLSAVSLYGDFNGSSIEPLLERNMNKQSMLVLKEKLEKQQSYKLPSNTSLASFFGIFQSETSFDNYDESSEADQALLNGLKSLYKRTAGGYDEADEFFSKARDAYKTLLEQTPENAELKKKAAIALEHVGIFKFLKNDPLAAHEDLKKAVEYFPRPNSYIYIALIMADKGQSTEYFDNFEKALELDPNCAAVYYHRGQMYFITQQFEQAGKDFEKAKELNNSNIFPYIQLACLTYREGNLEDSDTLFSEARRKFPTAPEVPNFYAETLSDQGDLAGARKQYDIAAKLEEVLEGIHVGVSPLIGKATLLSREPSVENFVEATELFEKACQMDPRSEQAKIGLAQLKLQQEDIDEAIALFEEAADLARSFDEKLQATTFAEATKIQKKIRADPIVSAKIEETLAAYRAQGMI
ncbi:LANO_0E12750g1_1 [Lachancea nothofagi CBS 11611]|uniref:LANO_0E12750g1_1 n=1 Tax=Lachancea nothofagi CBS 11611 TaxID=1266666 RepID=A0A1G4JYA9_9SACH|nr:LANO_0E12750g1_1 [Lachancea nothofagi CBS 11611]